MTLRVFLHELYDFTLLNAWGFIDCPNVLDFDLYSFGMGLSPYKLRIFELEFIQSFYFLQEDS
jgi:hypothetical protein